MLELILTLMLAQMNMPSKPIPSARNSQHYTYYKRGGELDATTKLEGGFALMGGGKDIDEAFQWMAERGGKGDFLVLRGSGGDGYQEYLDEITEANSVQTLVIKDREAASDPFVLDRVNNAEMIFLAGGDQWNYVGKWSKTPLLEALNAAILKGVPLGGTSAGLAVLGEYVFTAEKDGVSPIDAAQDPYNDRMTIASDFLEVTPLQGAITDTHFSQRDRLPRLISFMARVQKDNELKSFKGIGVDEATAALVTPEGNARVVGQHGVHLVSSKDYPEVCEPGQPLIFTGLEVTHVKAGESFESGSWQSPDRKPERLEVVEGQLIAR